MLLTWASSRGLPTLYLDFLSSESADSRLTISGGSGGTRVNSSGNIVSASAPRFDYDPVTLAAKGLLVEEQRTNLLLRSADFTLTWGGANTTAASAPGITAPDGTTAQKISDAATTNQHPRNQSVTISAGATYSASVWLKAAEYTTAWLQVGKSDFTTGFRAVVNLSGASVSTATFGTGTVSGATITAYPNGWYRVTVTGVVDATSTDGIVSIYLNNGASYAGNTANGMYAWGAQLEAGSFATSYIPTTTAQVTRTADSVTMTGANFSSWWSTAADTLFVEASSAVATSPQILVSVNDGTTNNRVTLFKATNVLAGRISVGGVATNPADSANTITTGAIFKAAIAVTSSDAAMVLNGGAATTAAPSALPTVNQLEVGSQVGGGHFNGWLRKVRDYPLREPNATMQVQTQ